MRDLARIDIRLRPVRDGVGDTLERHHAADGTQANRLLGHAEYDAAFFVLGDGECPHYFHGMQAVRPVVAHARQDDAQSVGLLLPVFW